MCHPRPLLLCIACLAAALVAGCTMTPEIGAQSRTEASPQNTQLVQGTPRPLSSATPDAAGTLAMASLNATLEERGFVRQIATETKSAGLTQSAYIAATATAAVPQATARQKALSTQDALLIISASQEAANATQTKDAPADAATAAYLIERTKWAGFDAWAAPLGIASGGLGVLILAVVLAYVIATRPQVVVPQPPAFAPYAPLPFSQAMPDNGSNEWTRRELPAGVDENHLIEMAQNVLTSRRPNGVPFSRHHWLHIMPRAEWDFFITYMIENGYAVKNNPKQPNSGVSLTGTGEKYLYQFENLPHSPTQDESLENGGLSSDYLPGRVEPTAGSMVDPFNIMPQPDQFLPTGPTLNAGIDPQKDEEK